MFATIRVIREWYACLERIECAFQRLRRLLDQLLALTLPRIDTIPVDHAPARDVRRTRPLRRSHGARSAGGHRPSAPRDGIPLAN